MKDKFYWKNHHRQYRLEGIQGIIIGQALRKNGVMIILPVTILIHHHIRNRTGIFHQFCNK